MKLFIKDHFSFVFLYLITFIGLPFIIEKLDGFNHHYGYFSFLAMTLLMGLLIIRYFCRRKMYARLEETKINKDSINIYQPIASVEKAYSDQLRAVSSLLLEEDEKHYEFLKEQELLISHAVHQMKIPVSVIQLLVQSNQRNGGDSLAWQKVKSECDKLTFFLNQLLSYSRSTQLLSDLKIEPIPLKKSVNEIVNDLKDYFIENEIYPKVEIPESIILYSDKKWIKVVIYQLLSNAIKYSDNGEAVHIKYDDGKLSIMNKGDTIPESEINRVFDLFYTGSKGRKKGESTGIGLYLVKKILTTLNHPFNLLSSQHKTICTINFFENIGTNENKYYYS